MNRIVVWVIAAGVLCVGLPMAASATEDCPQLVTDTSSSVLDESWFVQYTVGSRPGQGTKTTGHQWFSLNPDPESSTCGERGGWGNDPETTVPVTITAVSRATAAGSLSRSASRCLTAKRRFSLRSRAARTSPMPPSPRSSPFSR